MKFSTATILSSLATLAFAAPIALEPSDKATPAVESVELSSPLPASIEGTETLGVYEVPDGLYPISLFNGTHSVIYLVTMASLKAKEGNL